MASWHIIRLSATVSGTNQTQRLKTRSLRASDFLFCAPRTQDCPVSSTETPYAFTADVRRPLGDVLPAVSTSHFAFIHRAAPSGFPSHWSTENASAEFSQERTSFRIVEPGSICSHCTVPTSPGVSLAYAPPCPSSTCSSLRTASRHPSSLHSAAPSTKRPEHYFTKVICLRNTLIKTLWLLNALMQIYYYYHSLQNPEYDKFLLIQFYSVLFPFKKYLLCTYYVSGIL